jgi:hypothetical protein
MALKLRRGSEAIRGTITPAEGELIYTQDTKQVFVGDGSTLGGVRVTSGVAQGTATSLAGYLATGNVVSPTDNLTWNESINALKVDAGSITVNTQNAARSVLNINGHYNSGIGSQRLTFVRSRGYEEVPQSVQVGDLLGSVEFNGYLSDRYLSTTTVSSLVQTVTAIATGTVINFVSKSGTGPYYVTFSIPTQVAATVSRSYTVAGNANDLYNVSCLVSASTTTSITLLYITDPGTFGSGTTTATRNPIISTGLICQTTTTNGNKQNTLRMFNNGQLQVGPVATDFTDSVYDPTWHGQLNITSTQTTAGSPVTGAQMVLRTYANTSFTQSTNLVRHRGTVVAPTTVLSGDQVYITKYQAWDGTIPRFAAAMVVSVDDALSPGLQVVPGNIVFSVGSKGVSGTVAPVLKLASDLSTTFYGPTIYSGVEIAVPAFIDVATTGTYSLSTTRTTSILLITNSGLTATITMPPAPVDGQRVRFAVSGNSVTLTISGATTVLPSFAGVVTDGTSFEYVYRLSNTSWYKIG